jgi:muramoyltetrapeptide carboxypeptidase
MMKDIVKPRALKDGALISIVAPAGPVELDLVEKGVTALESFGFGVKHREDLFSRKGYLAGDDARRALELTEAFNDPETSAVWCARGGYGSMRLLGLLDLDAIAASRKPFIGFSDITALQLALLARTGFLTFHGPMMRFWREIEISKRHLVELLTGRTSKIDIYGPGSETVREGVCEGILTGGNLSVLASLTGTNYMPDLTGAILFLEDVNEEAYRIDRLLTHLRLAGILDVINGLVLGDLSGGPTNGITPLEVIQDLTAPYSFPVVFNFPFGHSDLNMALCQGLHVRLDASGRVITFLEPCVEKA